MPDKKKKGAIEPATSKSDRRFYVTTDDDVPVNGTAITSESSAEADAGERNARAEELGIKTRYKVK